MGLKQYITAQDLLMLTSEQQDWLWRWANRAKADRPKGFGLNGMPLLSVGRCIEFLIDHNISLSKLMQSLAVDFHEKHDRQLIDILWDCVILILNKININHTKFRYKWIKASDLITKGTMAQWINREQWKQLSDSEMAKLWKWANKVDGDIKLFLNMKDMPMLSIGRLLEFLTDNGMDLKEIFDFCSKYKNTEWNKMQLVDVLWGKVKMILKASVIKNI